MTILIRGGGVVNYDHSRRADVLLHEGAIAAIGVNLEAPAGAETIDAGGCYVMPGGIDPHTHLELAFMGTVTADDFEWGTKAALSGGTTTVVDFCIPNPGQSLLAAYRDWRRKAEGAACDYGFHMAITWWDRQVFDEMETVVKTYGINTFKHFMAYKGALMVNDDELYNSFLRCAGLGAMPLVHAENGDVVWHLQQHYLAAGVTGPEGHAYSRPPAVEGEAANRAIMIADMAGCPIYIVHTSCREAHEAIARARAAGKRVFGEPAIYSPGVLQVVASEALSILAACCVGGLGHAVRIGASEEITFKLIAVSSQASGSGSCICLSVSTAEPRWRLIRLITISRGEIGCRGPISKQTIRWVRLPPWRSSNAGLASTKKNPGQQAPRGHKSVVGSYDPGGFGVSGDGDATGIWAYQPTLIHSFAVHSDRDHTIAERY